MSDEPSRPATDQATDQATDPATDPTTDPASPPSSVALPPTADPNAPTGGTGETPPAFDEAEDASSEAPSLAEPAPPASLPPRAPEEPAKAEPRAWGGAYDVPLPTAPEAEDPVRLARGPWRGRFWLSLGLHVSIPVGGQAPGAGSVVAPVPNAAFGWRIRPFVGLHTAISNFAHDAATTIVRDDFGNETRELVHGRITAFDLLTARFYLPRPRRLEPWAELGAGIGARRGPLADRLEAAGLLRGGLGLDLWLAPIFSLAPTVAYRMIIIDRSVGHGLRVGLDLGIHW
ncbi:MAG: hypothetical protein KDK70_19000 [Myxococcales bacterium]|nr:hypothetical protein [Myxococcales bacterium]